MSKKVVKIVLGVVIILIIIVMAGGGYLYHRFQQGVPELTGTVQLAGLQDSVEITFDRMGIPQVWAKTDRDAYFAAGYLHASERLFQMDMTRRASQGRLAELLGKAVLFIDKYQRKIGHDRIAKKYEQQLSPQSRMWLQAYADGVNRYVSQCEVLPFEYQLLGQDFQQWTVFDCLTILSFQTWFSNYLMSPDEYRARIFDKFGAEKAKSLPAEYPGWAPLTVPQPQKTAISWRAKVRNALASAWIEPGTFPYMMAQSSNSWVVAPDRSSSGAAMLASDPHLETVRLPQFWYLMGLHSREGKLNMVGISPPGLPLIIMGHNGKSAWAFTVSGVDVNEYYQEKVNPQDSTLYLTPAGWEKFKIIKQKIQIAGEDQPFTLTVKETRHGPVIFDNDSLHRAYALHWAGFDINLSTSIDAMFRLMTVSDYQTFRQTVTRLGALDASWTYADKQGNIGYQLGTPVPVRNFEPHNLPVAGWTDEYEWHGFHSLDETPHSLNPERGWLAVCNNKPDQGNLNYRLDGYFYPERILRITHLLSGKEKISLQDMYDYQMDVTDDYVLRWKPEVVRLLKENGFPEEAAELSRWQGSAADTSHAMALMQVFLNQLTRFVFQGKVSAEDLKKIFPHDMESLYFSEAGNWFDDPRTRDVVETREQAAIKSIKRAVELCRGKTWGDIMTLTMEHPLAVVPVLGDLLPLRFGPYPWHGTNGTLNASFFLPTKEPGRFKSSVGPSWRFVIDFSNPDAATMVIPAGNSGHPFDKHFMDFFEMWRDGQRWNVPISYQKVRAKATRTMVLKP